MNGEKPETPPVALTIAGSDSSGGAGIQADLKTFTVLGCFGASALTAVTAQNTRGVTAAELLEPAFVASQIDAVAEDLPVAATKTGMLASPAIIEAVAERIARHQLEPLVVDPVMVAKSGDPLIDDDAVRVLAEKLMPLAMITTPNRHEAARLLDLDEPITTATAAGMAAQRICDRFGAATCIVTGIQRHRHGSEEATDVFFDGHEVHELSHPWRDTRSTHGSGCTFSAALAAGLALGKPLPGAVELARQFIAAAVSNDLGLGHGQGPVNHLAWLELER